MWRSGPVQRAREPGQGRKAAALSGTCRVPQIAWPSHAAGSAAAVSGRTRSAGVAGRARPPMAYQSLYRRYRPQRFGEVRGQDHVVTALRNAVARGPGRPRLPVQRPAGHGQDLDRPHPRQGRSTARTRSTASRAACASRASPIEARHRRSTSTSSTPRRTTASTPSATSSSKAALGTPGRTQGVHPRRGPHALDGGVERAAEDARGAAGARRVRARHHRPAEGVRHDRRGVSRSTSTCSPPTSSPYVRFVVDRRGARRQRRARSRRCCVRPPARPATRCPLSTRPPRPEDSIRRRCTRRPGRGAHRSRRRPGHRRGRSCDGERARRTVARRAPRCPATRCVPVVDGSRCAPASAHGRRPSG